MTSIFMTSIFTPRKFQNYCYVVKSEDDNSYDVLHVITIVFSNLILSGFNGFIFKSTLTLK